eukprot:16430050-Heterocapsa_arctica.AAC.1
MSPFGRDIADADRALAPQVVWVAQKRGRYFRAGLLAGVGDDQDAVEGGTPHQCEPVSALGRNVHVQ